MSEWLDTMQILLPIEIWKIRGLKARNLLSSRDGKGVRLLNKENKKEKKEFEIPIPKVAIRGKRRYEL